MKHLPLFFDLAGRRVVVVGEGAKAKGRADLARSAGAEVIRLAPAEGRIGDFRGASAAFVATGDLESDTAAQRLAREAGVPVNVADRPGLCDFILPAIVDRGEVVVAEDDQAVRDHACGFAAAAAANVDQSAPRWAWWSATVRPAAARSAVSRSG